MKSATLQLETLTCPSCMQKIEGALKAIDGIDQNTVNVSFNSSRVKFDFDDEKANIDTVEDAINRVGFEVLKTRVK